MIVNTEAELNALKKVSEAVAITLKKMRAFTRPGMSTKELDDYGKQILESYGAKSAPMFTYKFPGCTCISLNNEIAHGIPSVKRIIQEGDLLNIDVSAELNGYWADNGGSFVVGKDIHGHQKLVDTSLKILYQAISMIHGGRRIAEIGKVMETLAKKSGYKVIKNLGGHGVGKSLHEEPDCILNYYDRFDCRRFRKNSVIALETFISTASTLAETDPMDGWTLLGNRGGVSVQHEHTILVTGDKPVILTEMNEIATSGII